MAGGALVKRLIVAALAIGFIGYAWYIQDESSKEQTPPQSPAGKSDPSPDRFSARSRTTRPTTQLVQRAPLNPFQIPQPLRRLEGHTDTLRCLALSADSTMLVTGGNDRTVRLWDLATGNLLRTFEGHTRFVVGVGFSPDAGKIISCGDDRTVRVWDAKTGEQLSQLEGHQNSIFAASFLSEPNLAISASHDGTARIWDVDKETTIHKIDLDQWLCEMAVDRQRNLLALGTHGGHVYLWDLKTRTQIREFSAAGGCIQSLVFSSDGRRLLVCPEDSTFRIFDTATGKVVFEDPEGEPEHAWRAALSSDGEILAVGRRFEIVFYNLKTGQRCKTFIRSMVFYTHDMCFVPGTTLLITAGGGYMTANETWLRPREDKLLIWKLPQPLP